MILVSLTKGARPYLRTPDGLTGACGRIEFIGCGCGTVFGRGCGAGVTGVDGMGSVVVGIAVTDCDRDEKISAVMEAPAAAEPAAIKAIVDFDITADH